MIAAALICLLLLAIWLNWETITHSRAAHQKVWILLQSQSFNVVSLNRCFFDFGPYKSAGAFHQPVFRVVTQDPTGILKTAWVRCPLPPGELEIEWDT
jgi:hypothetical protein